MLCCRCKKEILHESVFCNFCGKRQITVSAPQAKRRRRPKGSGTVYKMGGNRKKQYVAAKDGKILGWFATAGEAVLFLDNVNSNSLDTQLINYTLQQVFDSFTQNSPKYKKLTQESQDGLKTAWSRIEHLANKKALEVTVVDYQNAIDASMIIPKYKIYSEQELQALRPNLRQQAILRQANPPKPTPLGYDGKNRIKQLVSHLYAEMMRLQITKENLSNLLVLPSNESQSKMRNFTDDEIKLLKENDTDNMVKMILVYIGSGMRLNELLKLRKDNVNLDEKILTGGSKSEAGRNRVVPIRSDIFSYVEFLYLSSNNYLFENEKTKAPYSSDLFRSKFYKKLEAIGIVYQNESGANTLTPHRTRHTFTANAIQSGVAPEALTKVAGWSKYDVAVNKYANSLDIDFLRDEMEKTPLNKTKK